MSVLDQDTGVDTMQIEVIDDCSNTDDPAKVVQEIAGNRVVFFQQPQNVGHVRNFETCLKRARGRLIHLLHGDDCVRSLFYQKMQRVFETIPQIQAVFCRSIIMDEDDHWQTIDPLEQKASGVLSHWLDQMAIYNHIRTPAMVVRREVYEALGGFDTRLSYTEDWEMWARIAAHYPVWYEVEPLALYRKHPNSSTSRHQRTGKNLMDLRRAVSIIQEYLPPQVRAKAFKEALKHQVSGTLYDAKVAINSGDRVAAWNQLKEALRYPVFSLSIWVKIAIVVFKLIMHSIGEK
jgi:glycosyltransferase involved in cell wall biosynthesis